MKQLYTIIFFFLFLGTTQAQFVFKVETTTANETFTIPTKPGETYAYQVNYTRASGELPRFENANGSKTLTFVDPGVHTVSIDRIAGDFFTVTPFPAIYFNNTGDKDKIVSIEQWGNNKWVTMEGAFHGCSNLVLKASDEPDLGLVVNMTSMFEGTTSLEDLRDNIGNWNTNTIENLTNTFKSSGFNENIDSWNVSNVRFIDSMFEGATNFNQPLNSWITTSLEFANAVFKRATNFNQELNNWNMSSVQEVGQMFLEAQAFNQNIGAWDISNIIEMGQIFWSSGISVENYDATIQGWATLTLGETAIPTNISLQNVTSIAYCDVTSRAILENTYNWSFGGDSHICPEEDKFITTWKTNATGISGADARRIVISTVSGYDYYYSVDWGDGTITNNHTGNTTHNYAIAGTYQVKIYGVFPAISSNTSVTRMERKIRSIDQWGSSKWLTMKDAFRECDDLDVLATDIPDVSEVTDMSGMFFDCTNLGVSGTLDFSGWNTSSVTTMKSMFFQGDNFTGANIGNWDVGKVTDFNGMFTNAPIFNENLNGWNVGEFVTGAIDMGSMFLGAFKFNSPLNNWDVSKVTRFIQMFFGASDFNQDLGSWDISSGSDFAAMLSASGLSSENYDKTLEGWGTLSAGETTIPTNKELGVLDLRYADPVHRERLANNYSWTFDGDAYGGIEEEKFITTWTVSGGDLSIPIYMLGTSNDYTVDWGDGSIESGFTGDTTHTYATAGTYTVKIYGDFSQLYFFNRAGKEKLTTIEQWGTNKWTGLDFSFYGCSNLELNADDVPDLSQVTSLGYAFQNASSFTDAKDKLKDWNVSTITDFAGMFQGTAFNRNISGWNMQAADNISLMFYKNTVFNQPIGSWTFNNLTKCEAVFWEATSFNQDLSNWDVSKVTIFNYMFNGATSFNQSLANWDVGSVQGLGLLGMDKMFENAGLSTDNYDATLFGWATLDAGETQIPNDITFHGGNSNYCIGSSVRQSLINNNKWIITDGGLVCDEEDKFISTWKTISNNERVQIRTTGGGSSFAIDWGDGNTTAEGGSSSHTYATPGTYTVKVSGAIGQLYANYRPEADKMESVEQWGAAKFTSFRRAFAGADNVVINATDTPDLSNVTTMVEAFNNSKKLVDNGGQIKNWDVSNIEDFTSAFQGASLFDVDLGNWDLSNAQLMNNMLNGTALSVANYDATLKGWASNSNTPNDLNFGASNLKYCFAETDRNTLDVIKNWTINDAGLGCATTDFFITTWQTTSANESITIPTTGSGYNYTVNWGDGSFDTNMTGNASHVYATAGIYRVKISGDFPRIYFNNLGDKNKITSIDQWGSQQWASMASAFYGCSNLELNVSDTPDLSSVTSMERMFMGTTNIVDNEASMNSWNTSTITNMANMFANSIFDFNISSWNVGNVTNFFRMFDGNTAFNQNITGWNIGENVTGTINMSVMFKDTNTFNQPIGNWDVSKVTSMNGMFQGAKKFNQSLANWNVSNVTEFISMFEDAEMFNQSLGDWDISSATNMNDMLKNSVVSTNNYDTTLIGWANLEVGEIQIPTGVTFNANTIQYCLGETDRNKLTNSPYNWNITDGGTNCSNDFFITTWQTTSPNENITIPTTGTGYNYAVDWGDGIVELGFTGDAVHTYATAGTYTVRIKGDFPRIYFGGSTLANAQLIQTIEQWGTQKWTSMEEAFKNCGFLKIEATNIPDLSDVSSMVSMFENGSCIDNGGNLGTWNTSTITLMDSMFRNATMEENINSWDVSSLKSMNYMFTGCEDFNSPLNQWNTINLESAIEAFSDTKTFNQNLGDWNISNVTDFTDIFRGTTGFSDENYDKTLIGWANLESEETLSLNVSLGAGNAKYCLATSARNMLISAPYNWTITDGGNACNSTDFFITTWQTTTDNEIIIIPTTGTGYNYSVDWGDGKVTSEETGNASHEYATAGTYTVRINGDFPQIYFFGGGSNNSIQSIDQWGTQVWRNMNGAFFRCSNLVINATDIPNLSNVTDFNQTFVETTSLTDNGGKMKDWDVSNITSMSNAFSRSGFNENINDWNVSNVTNFSRMFQDNRSFNQPLDQWIFNQESSAQINALNMFFGASAFNQDISGWNTSKFTVMTNMFRNAVAFDRDVSNWDISNATDVSNMFTGSGFSQANFDNLLIAWSTLEGGEIRIPTGLTLDTDTTYCFGADARDVLTSAPYNWIINDGGASCTDTDFFITTWQTTTDNESITIPTIGANYNYTVDWGDGTIEGGYTGNATHEYTTSGTYTVKITGDFPRIHFNAAGDKDKIISVDQWGTQQWTSMDSAFRRCGNLEVKATDAPDLSLVTSLRMMFRACSSLDKNFKVDFSGWNTSGIENFGYTFADAAEFNSNSITNWNVGSASSFIFMFQGAVAFNQDISNWNIGENVTGNVNMFSMFLAVRDFNQPIGKWDVSKVTNTGMMFRQCENFDQDLGQWDISNMTNMSDMFRNTAFSKENYDATLIGWANKAVGEVIPMNINFNGGDSNYCLGGEARNILISAPYNWTITDGGIDCDFTNAFITTWETTSANESITIPTAGSGYSYAVDWGDGTVESGFTGDATHEYVTAGIYSVKVIGDFPRIHFDSGSNASQIQSVEQWGTQVWTSMEDAFRGCSNLVINATDSPDLSNVTNMSYMFNGCDSIGSADFSGWNTSNVTNMRSLFAFSRFNGNISTWNVGKVSNFNGLFENSTRFNQDISQWNIGEFVTGFIDMAEMFRSANRFNQSLNNWDVSKVDRMHFMFQRASRYNQPMNNWNVSNVLFMNEMFDRALNFNQDLSSWDISSTSTMVNMLTDTSVSQENYDATLIGWSTLEAGETIIPANLTLNADVTYCLGEAARNTLSSAPFNWNITDGGKDCSNVAFWSGNTNTSWTETANWIDNALPLTTNDVVIQDIINQPIISSGVVAEMNDLTIETLAGFDISDNGAVIVNGDLTVNETIGITSSVNTSGTLIVKGTSNGMVTFERSGLEANKWSMITAPVSGQSIKEFIENAANDIRVNTSVIPNRYAVAYYDDSQAAGSKWVYYTADDIVTNTLTFEKGKGYIISRETNGSVTFTGNLTTVDETVTVASDQWNAIGNPYTAYLPINKNATMNFIQENMSKFNPAYVAVYAWSNDQNKYVAKTLLDSDTSFTVGQGFFVKIATGVSSINFRENQRLSDATGIQTFSRGAVNVNTPSIEIMATQSDITVNTHIKYLTNATRGMDTGYDIGNFNGSTFDIYTHLIDNSEGNGFTIQSLPETDYSNSIIPLGITSEAGKKVQISAKGEGFDRNLNIYLEDKLTNSFVQINNGGSYTFTPQETINGIGRFYIHTEAKVLGIDEVNNLSNIKIFKSGKQELAIQGLQNGEEATVHIFSLLGNEVYKEEIIGATTNTIVPTTLEVGVYLVRIETIKGTKSKKVVFKK
ncbi:BspA family leucine-rich repeat surface protein [Tenacibaculum amylolyticum]|uniref:BspA family leucine-rich repeat surface protein n=1 Tax=Tenacibaculum amylolyticum TaxID=104269 RepID=UPI00389362AC